MRLAAGKGPVGFINPTLYANPDAFNDITSGTNQCTVNLCCQAGFFATTGWDPATGLGSVQYASLQKIFLNVSTSPNLYFAPSLSPAYVPPVISNSSTASRLSTSTVFIIIGCVIGGVIVVWLLLICIRIRLSGAGIGNRARVSLAPVQTTASFTSTSPVTATATATATTTAAAIDVHDERPGMLRQTSFGVEKVNI